MLYYSTIKGSNHWYSCNKSISHYSEWRELDLKEYSLLILITVHGSLKRINLCMRKNADHNVCSSRSIQWGREDQDQFLSGMGWGRERQTGIAKETGCWICHLHLGDSFSGVYSQLSSWDKYLQFIMSSIPLYSRLNVCVLLHVCDIHSSLLFSKWELKTFKQWLSLGRKGIETNLNFLPWDHHFLNILQVYILL
jgi:hypothetical protein